MAWIRVKKDFPCPICEHTDWCSVAKDGKGVLCMRVDSPKPQEAGGWYHSLKDPIPAHRLRPKKAISSPAPDFSQYRDRFKMGVANPKLYHLATMLGLPAESLIQLEAGWNGKEYTFPMYDGRCECIGIRLRAEKGAKFAVKGSKNGLFVPLAGAYPDSRQTLYICEGETDTAALVAMRIPAIGRPACQTGTEYIKQFLGNTRRDVIIIADRDKPHERPDGTLSRPGIEGAQRLAQAIHGLVRGVKVVLPPLHKDVRAWYHAGGTGNAVLSLAANTAWTKKISEKT